VTSVPPGPLAAPLIEPAPRNGDAQRWLPRSECERAGGEGSLLIKGFFAYHKQGELSARRLLLAPPPPPVLGGGRHHRKRKAPTSGDRTLEVETAGATFGCTLGNIVGYLEGRGIPAERAYILRSMRTLLLPAAEAVRYMRGTDVEHLARGMASCRVVQPQRAALHEVNLPEFPKLDHKYGHACTVVGTTAALLVVFHVMSTVPAHADHLWKDGSLWKALNYAEKALDAWRPATVRMPEDHWEALGAEKRALRRATMAAFHEWKRPRSGVLEASSHMASMIEAARAAAFPGGELVNEYTQAKLLDRLAQYQEKECMPFAGHARVEGWSVTVLPLAELPGSMALVTGGRRAAPAADDDGDSCASSSWRTLSSNASGFSHVSQDSLGGLAEAFVGQSVVV
jgi:hypothetical protein